MCDCDCGEFEECEVCSPKDYEQIISQLSESKTEFKVGELFGFDEIPSKYNTWSEYGQFIGQITTIANEEAETAFVAEIFFIHGFNTKSSIGKYFSWSGGSWSDCGSWKIQDTGIVGYNRE